MTDEKIPDNTTTSAELLEYMGTDAEKWTQMFLKAADLENAGPDFVGLTLGWFANAIETGRSAQYLRSIAHLAIQVNRTAHEKGWWESKRLFDGVLMLIVSEAAEALEEWRDNRKEGEGYFSIPADRPALTTYDSDDFRDRIFNMDRGNRSHVTNEYLQENFSLEEIETLINTGYLKPEGIPSELADIIIRVMDCAVEYDIDIEEEVINKMAYNATRSHKHGGKRS